MAKTVIKSVEYEDLIEEQLYKIKVLIISLPEDFELSNVDPEEYKDFVFKISVTAEPTLPSDFTDINHDFVYKLENGGENRIGQIESNAFVELEENRFLQGLQANALSMLQLAGDTGHFKA